MIKKKLKLGPTALSSTWRYVPNSASEKQGAQIDLLFDRKDDAVTICEIKCTDEPLSLTRQDITTLQRKIDIFQEKTQTKKQIFIALISANGLKKNQYSEEFITDLVTLDDLFLK